MPLTEPERRVIQQAEWLCRWSTIPGPPSDQDIIRLKELTLIMIRCLRVRAGEMAAVVLLVLLCAGCTGVRVTPTVGQDAETLKWQKQITARVNAHQERLDALEATLDGLLKGKLTPMDKEISK